MKLYKFHIIFPVKQVFQEDIMLLNSLYYFSGRLNHKQIKWLLTTVCSFFWVRLKENYSIYVFNLFLLKLIKFPNICSIKTSFSRRHFLLSNGLYYFSSRFNHKQIKWLLTTVFFVFSWYLLEQISY